MKLFSTLVLVCTFVGLGSSQDDGGINSIESSQEQARKECNLGPGAEANRIFAFSVFRTVATRGSPTKNVFLAPTTIATGLAMILAGAGGSSKKQIWNGLGFNTTGLTEDDIPCLLKMYSNQLIEERMANKIKVVPEANAVPDANPAPKANQPNPLVIETAGRLYGEKSCSFNKTFIHKTSNYGAEMQPLDFRFDTEGALETMNNWVAEQTNNKIEDLFSPGDIESSTKLAIVSVVYFKGLWTIPFPKEDTFDGNFHVDEDTVVTASFMGKLADYRSMFSEYLGADVFELQYKKDTNGIYDASMIVIAPRMPLAFNITKFVTEDTMGKNGVIGKLLAQEPQRTNIVMPKFKISAQYDLKPILKRIGIRHMWLPEKADLSGMIDRNGNSTEPLYVSSGVHKTFIKVDEAGTEAAGATGFGIIPLSLPPTIFVDKPFMIVIYEKSTNSILFIGKIGNPTK